MTSKLVVGPFQNKGLQTNVKPFNVDNTSFPVLVNAYQWRGQIKRKRGTEILTRLSRYFNSASTSFGIITSFNLVVGAGNLLTGFGLQINGNIIPGTVSFVDSTQGTTYTDPAMNGQLLATGGTGTGGTINYATGAITIVAGAAGTITTASFNYYPDLPVMGFRDFNTNSSQFPGNLAFDTVYAYNVLNTFPYSAYNVSFYKNPVANGTTLPGYVPKTVWTPLKWNGENYQQFYTVNYQGALWASNGIKVPFDPTKISMQYKPIITVTVILGGPPATATLQITAHGLVVGDFVFVNEVVTTTGINFQTGYVITVTDANNVIVEFPFATIATNGTGGIAQYLTSNSDSTKDCIRWYDGDPTDGVLNPQGFVQGRGWVNFMPPLSRDVFSISGLPAAQYYLVGAKIISVYKDRLIFFGPVVQTSAAGSQVYLQDTAIFSQNGTPFYTSSFTYIPATSNDPTLASIAFHEILVPVNQTATAPAWFEDQTGFGGYIAAGLDEPIFSVGTNEDALIVGFDNIQTRFVYTGNDIIPFLFYIINSELGSSSVFSVIQMDQGVLARGDRGLTITGQTQTQRIDLDIPDEVFQMQLLNNGAERICSARDFINEWAYFTYPANNTSDSSSIGYVFPTKTLLYNYRDVSWAIFFESYTTYGQFNRQTGFTWATVGGKYPTWADWNDPWDSGTSTLLQPEVVAGNQQGFLIVKDIGTGEATSLYIQSFSGSTITSPDHCLNEGDFIIITGCLGTIGQQVNGRIFQVDPVTTTTFLLDPTITSGTYFGGGVITRMYIPLVQTRQFPAFWEQGKKTRIGMQQYLLDTTASSQMTLLIFLSQNAASPYNSGPIVPQNFPLNSSLVYSTVLFTCPESANLGLTPYTINLQMPEGEQQAQIWHRINTSLIGDTVQLGFTLSEDQMKSLSASSQSYIITGATAANPVVLTTNANFGSGQLVRISGVVGMTQLNGNIYNVLSSTTTHTTLELDGSAFSTYISGGSAVVVAPLDQFAEIVLHGFIMDLTAASSLS